MPKITTRKATLADLPLLLTFEAGIVAAERPFDSTLKEGEIHYYDIAYMIDAPHIEIIVAEFDDELIGSGYVRIDESKIYLKHNRHAFLGFMYVKPKYRGIGVNNMVMEALKEWAVIQGLDEFRLEVYNDNEAAIRAYEKVGFSKLLIYMRKGLNDNSDKNL